MHRRSLLALFCVTAAAFVAACGSDGATLPAAAPPTESPDPVTSEVTEPAADLDSAAEPLGGPILTLTYEGGFTTQEYAFQNPVAVMVTDGGRVITLSADPTSDSLLRQHDIQTIDSDGIDALRGVLDDAGLFADVTYERDDFIADAATTTLVVVADDGTEYRHEAYALGTGGGLPGDPASSGTDPTLVALAGVVSSLVDDLDGVVGAGSLGPTEPWVPKAVQITVTSLTGADISAGTLIEPWPASAEVRLDDPRLGDPFACVEVADPAVIELLMSSSFPTLFSENVDPAVIDDEYQVAARPAYPGRGCED